MGKKIRLTIRNGDDVVSQSTVTLFSKTMLDGNDSEEQLEASTIRRNHDKVQMIIIEEDDERFELSSAAFLRFRCWNLVMVVSDACDDTAVAVACARERTPKTLG